MMRTSLRNVRHRTSRQQIEVSRQHYYANGTLRQRTTAAEYIRSKAVVGGKKRIVLSEGDDERVCQAAFDAAKAEFADIVLLVPDGNMAKHVHGIHDCVDVVAPQDHPEFERLVSEYGTRRSEARERKRSSKESMSNSLRPVLAVERNMLQRSNSFRRKEEAEMLIDVDNARSSLFFANLLVREGFADGTVSGANHSSGSVVSSALRCLGLQSGVRTLSSFFVMDFPQLLDCGSQTMIFADCCVVVDPSSEQLAEIATMSAISAQSFLNEDELPRVGMLSFSTQGSSSAPQGAKVRKALEIVRNDPKSNSFGNFDGELQLDAACVPEVAQKKAPMSPLSGRSNVLIFPSLEAGNIAYKLAERFGGATAIGPILQGLRHPANDLSRGCSVSDVVDVAASTALQATTGARTADSG